ncbi:hypothetical protein P8C59_006341 [Phyllachora maydis]|uniref:Threonine aspartase n=1 Tax=Phyllachora maydis TaxID=1825666 RepID=A0AAD9I7H9_9PEZI|nr:hypothetical protein P8C59_006341 [Phyllachora maydis]
MVWLCVSYEVPAYLEVPTREIDAMQAGGSRAFISTLTSDSSSTDTGSDGAVDRIWKRNARPVAAIFIHAGAGYHSIKNEKVHLDACSEAARIGMKFLKAGGGAPAAVEAAIRSLEDKEITNAGFGSNLNMDGVVECDATLVDHLGRSGACGAVPGIKNPISLAKLILDASNQPLAVELREATSCRHDTTFPPLPMVGEQDERRKRKASGGQSPAGCVGSGFNGDASDLNPDDADTDRITDTVGAIAIDSQGNIAAGSSSGGIGMKHGGRIGPAALVGIGTAVIPEDPADDEARSVAAVTSGTGEHMATSLASARCAERLFHGARRGAGGRHIDEDDDRALMEAFVIDDFMGHPGVRNQTSPGAIGVMAVKKCRAGIYFYFAHNTDSFALASMTATEREPVCVMSRLGQSGDVAQGARKIPTS